MKYIILSMVILLASCASGNYKGDRYFYTESNGVKMECRPSKQGECKPESEWDD